MACLALMCASAPGMTRNVRTRDRGDEADLASCENEGEARLTSDEES